uniref:hypothetical protein n=1 Tax=Gemmiger formicilis TaxID=745368 RepID=UPI004029AEE9
VRAYFNKLREKYIANGQINQKSLGARCKADAGILQYFTQFLWRGKQKPPPRQSGSGNSFT